MRVRVRVNKGYRLANTYQKFVKIGGEMQKKILCYHVLSKNSARKPFDRNRRKSGRKVQVMFKNLQNVNGGSGDKTEWIGRKSIVDCIWENYAEGGRIGGG